MGRSEPVDLPYLWGRVLARAGSMRRYAELVEAAGPAWGFAPLPRWRCGLVALLAVRGLTRWKDPVAVVAEAFDSRLPAEATAEYRWADALLREIVKKRADEAAYTIDELAGRHGVRAPTPAGQRSAACSSSPKRSTYRAAIDW